MERDKVVAGLERCTGGKGCDGCPYDGDGYCQDRLMKDALELVYLRERQARVIRRQRDQVWEKLARITGEREAEWLEEVPDV